MGSIRASSCSGEDALIGGRYRVDRELARGGMGTVYRVFEESTGHAFALKRLRASATVERRIRVMFEREYQMLARIDHPRIIRVYDYGEDANGPFYTMELLEGSDLRDLAPLPYTEACRHLRDVALSLTLLHSRGYLHRDVSPRNVRLDGSGRPKLIDFGAMACCGVMSEVMGTPPCIPPEAMERLPLDPRSDLFGLGAVAYWLLTGKHAYPASEIKELPKIWRRPVAPPSALMPAIPERLDRLVLSLLSPQAGARPSSALEVIDALDSIMERAPEEEREFAESYLGSSPLVGRDAALGRGREALGALSRGRGSATLFVGDRGTGRTRLLNEIRVEALLSGCVIASADAEVERGPYRVTRAIVADLLRAIPDLAAGHGSTPFDPQSFTREQTGSQDHLQRGQGRVHLQKGIEDWLCEIAATRRLVLLLDNVQLADEPSTALFASLALRAPEEPICIIATQRLHDDIAAPKAIEVFASASTRLEVPPLSERQTEELVSALFTGDCRAGRLATWMHKASGGNPLSCMEISRHLIAHGIARYAQGVWVLPRELSIEELPSNLSAALAMRIGALDDMARELAEILCVHRGPLPLDLLAEALQASSRDTLVAVDQLLTRGVAAESEQGLRLANEALRETLSAEIAATRRATLHRRIGEVLWAMASSDFGIAVDAGWHLMRGGRESEGADVLARLAPEIERLVLVDAVPALEAAARVYERENRPEGEQVGLRASLATLSLAVDFRLKKYGHPTVDHLARLTGMTLAGSLQRYLGGRFGLGAGIAWGRIRYACVKSRRAPQYSRLFQQFLSTLGSLSGVAIFCADVEELQRLARHLAPFEHLRLGTTGREMHALVERLLAQVEGREGDALLLARRSYELTADRGKFLDLPLEVRRRLHGGVLASLGVLSVYRASGGALAVADELAALGDPISELFGIRLRMLHHVLRGESKIAATYADQMERHAMRGESMWQAEVTLPVHLITAYALTCDVVGMKRTMEQLERLAGEIPSLAVLARATRAAYLARSGRARLAVELFEQVMAEMQPRRMYAWVFMAGIYAGCLNDLGQHESAAALCRERLAHVQDGDRAFTAHYLEIERQLALADAGLGNSAAAATRLDALLQELAGTRHPLVLGLLHHARARVACQMTDSAAFDHHFAAMRAHFLGTENPALIAQCERFAAESAAANSAARAPRRDADDACELPHERARRALELLAESTRATHGYLYQMNRGGLVLAATVGSAEAPPELGGAIWSAVDRGSVQHLADDEATALVESCAVTAEPTDAGSGADSLVSGDHPNIFLLTVMHGSISVVVGAVALRREDGPISAPSARVLAMIARTLREHEEALSEHGVQLAAAAMSTTDPRPA